MTSSVTLQSIAWRATQTIIASRTRVRSSSTNFQLYIHTYNQFQDCKPFFFDLTSVNYKNLSTAASRLTERHESKQNSKNDTKERSSRYIPIEEQKLIDIAIVGAPNAGKSQLLNCMTQSNIAAVSRKRHTTRNEILGCRTINDTQMIFIDTPGYLRLKTAKHEKLLKELITTASSEMDKADYTLLVIDAAKKIDDALKEALVFLMLRAMFATPTGRFGIVLNKVDLVNPKHKLLEIADMLGQTAISCIEYESSQSCTNEGIPVPKMNLPNKKPKQNKDDSKSDDDDSIGRTISELYPEFFYVSALHNDGVDDILNHLIKIAPNEEWIYEAHEQTQFTPVERVEEIIREKIYRCVHREVPHNIHQVNRVFEVLKNPNQLDNKQSTAQIIRIDQDLIVKTESHRRILKGKHGKTLQRIQAQAKQDIERVLNSQVSLHLHVKKTNSRHDRNLESNETYLLDFD